MIARGVFKPGTKLRTAPPVPGANTAARRPARTLSTDEIRQALKTYLEPHLKV